MLDVVTQRTMYWEFGSHTDKFKVELLRVALAASSEVPGLVRGTLFERILDPSLCLASWFKM